MSKRLRIAVGSLMQESNSFTPVPTRMEEFGLVTGAAAIESRAGTRTELAGFVDTLRSTDAESVPLFSGFAMTSGPILEAEFRRMLDLIRDCFRNAGTLDGALVAFHGAMCAQGTGDCGAEMLRVIREIAGDALPLALTYDLHANVTRAAVEQVQILVGYQTYPHIDLYETGETAAGLLLRHLRGEIHAATAMQKVPLIVPAENMQTTHGPLAEVQQVAAEWRRRPGVLSTSVFCVQPWLDVAECGAAVVVVHDASAEVADACCKDLAAQLWDRRRSFAPELVAPAEAITLALAEPSGTVVLSESSDSPTAGSPGDSADVLFELLSRTDSVPAAFWVRDPEFVEMCWQHRPGDSVSGVLGGKLDPSMRKQGTVTGRIRSLSTGEFVLKGDWFKGVPLSMGRTAVLEIGKVLVVVSELATSMIDPELYRSQGIEPRDCRIVLVKSATGFRRDYEPFAARVIIVDTPGASSANLRALPFRHVTRPVWPLDDEASL
jgi:microcystin degradation protein MlrC